MAGVECICLHSNMMGEIVVSFLEVWNRMKDKSKLLAAKRINFAYLTLNVDMRPASESISRY